MVLGRHKVTRKLAALKVQPSCLGIGIVRPLVSCSSRSLRMPQLRRVACSHTGCDACLHVRAAWKGAFCVISALHTLSP